MPDAREVVAAANAVSRSLPSDLSSAETIKSLYETVYLPRAKSEKGWKDWRDAHACILRDVRNASLETLASTEFQKRLWENNPVSSSGACSVSMKKVVSDTGLAQWIATAAKSSLPPRGVERIQQLQKFCGELCDRVKSLTDRMPWLRILRTVAAIFPEDYSTVASETRLLAVGKAMFGKLSKEYRDSWTLISARILDRLTDVLGPTDASPEELALRSEFVWFLWEVVNGNTTIGPEGQQVEVDQSEEPLVFLPVARRLKGVSPIADPIGTILETVEFVSANRPTRAAVIEFLRSQNPNLKKASAAQYLNCVWNVFGMLQLNGETLELSPAGKAFLASENLDILIRPFLSKTIGPDLVLWQLKHQGQTPSAKLVAALKNHYRGWTTDFMPQSILGWGRAFELWAAERGAGYALTERGKRWADLIVAEPQPVPAVVELGDEEDEDEEPPPAATFSPPSLIEIRDAFRNGAMVIADEVVVQLHAALHSSDRKHFVLLSGLSGTGKTQLARAYANAYHRIGDGSVNRHFLLVSVQPDWTDATGLLGYVNPLGEETSYVRTECVKFLLKAHESPAIPHFLCLDEMNLARVEYYFAPFLSAMETDGRLVFHHEDEPVNGVPAFIPWPKNLHVLGTVNMDETTHAFSDKVLDRAFTIEFWDVDLDEYGRRYAQNNQAFPGELLQEAMGILKEAAAILTPIHQHFGYRTAGEVLGFLRVCGDSLSRGKAVDQAIFMKVLPKIRGQDTEPMRQALNDLYNWAEKHGFVGTAEKVRAMRTELRDTGTTRFWR